MWVRTGVATACGPRPDNQDRAHADAQVLAVFDGVAGRPLGGVAAAVGLGHAVAAMANSRARGAADVAGALRAAGQAVYDTNRRVGLNSATTGTLVALYSVDGNAHAMVGWVGDTSAFLVRGAGILKLTRPHLQHENRVGARISRWLGEDSSGSPETQATTVTADDRIVVISDGVTDVLSEAIIGGIVAGAESPQAAAEQLIAAAVQLGTSDNATVAAAFLTRDPSLADRSSGPLTPAAAEVGLHGDDRAHVVGSPVRQPSTTDTIKE